MINSNNLQLPSLRKFPYPYKATLSICSDIDDTDTCDKFKKIQSFMLDTIGLPFANTFFPYHDKGYFSFLSSSKEDKATIINNIHKGYIDGIHSYGEKIDFTRDDAEKALNELNQNECKLNIWIDHSKSKSNLCKYRFFGKGDIPGAPEYHFDITKKYGIRFIWTERLTNIIGQETPITFKSLLDIFDIDHPVNTLLNTAKTSFKLFLSYIGCKKYNFFHSNSPVIISTLNDGTKIFEFIRFNNYYLGPAKGDSFEDLHYLISDKMLTGLKNCGGYSIIYVHLGRRFYPESEHGKKTNKALSKLKKEFEKGNILVTSTSKLLHYYVTSKYLKWSYTRSGEDFNIHIHGIDDPVSGFFIPAKTDLNELTFYAPHNTKIYFNDTEMINFRKNSEDHTGQTSLTII